MRIINILTRSNVEIETRYLGYAFFLPFLVLLMLGSCGVKPPSETGSFVQSDLVDLRTTDPTLLLEIRYAGSNNFVGRPVYEEPGAFLQRPAALALLEASQDLREMGYGLKIFDAYRPWSVTKLFWDITPREKRDFVADPRKGSRHNRGCAVDLTLYELSTGDEVEMPSGYDEFTERAYPDYEGGTENQRKMRDLLISVMEANDFQVYDYEWWHFDYKNWREYRIQNISFSEIE